MEESDKELLSRYLLEVEECSRIQIENDKKDLQQQLARLEDPNWIRILSNPCAKDECERILKKIKSFNPVNLSYWFAFDTWSVYEGLLILKNADPRSVLFDEDGNIYSNEENLKNGKKTPTYIRSADELHIVKIDGLRLRDPLVDDLLRFKQGDDVTIGFRREKRSLFRPTYAGNIQRAILRNYYSSLKFWKSGDHDKDRYPPQYFIEWAISKNMPPQWLDWAKENNLIGNNKKQSSHEKEINAKSESAYLNIIGALFGELLSEKRKTNPKITQTSLIEDLSIAYDGYSGLSKTNLGQKIPGAIRRISKPS